MSAALALRKPRRPVARIARVVAVIPEAPKPPGLAKHPLRLHLSEGQEQLLRWWFQEDYRGDVGVKSNMGAIIEALNVLGYPKDSYRDTKSMSDARFIDLRDWHTVHISSSRHSGFCFEVGEREVDAAEEMRHFKRRLNSLRLGLPLGVADFTARDLLDDLFSASPPADKNESEVWGELLPILAYSPTARREHAQSDTQLPLRPWLALVARRAVTTQNARGHDVVLLQGFVHRVLAEVAQQWEHVARAWMDTARAP